MRSNEKEIWNKIARLSLTEEVGSLRSKQSSNLIRDRCSHLVPESLTWERSPTGYSIIALSLGKGLRRRRNSATTSNPLLFYWLIF
ncbi:hypothetical protein K1719_013170 [Acacia pycnantha]|nr:hypothetical protein K1719_013170 [Acacia pycnantha]